MSNLRSTMSAAAPLQCARTPVSNAPRRAVLAVLALSLLLFPGCEGTFAKYSASSRVKQLHEAVKDFNKYVRWQEWERASDYVAKDDREAFKSKFQEIEEEFRITEFEIRHTDVDDVDSKFAETTVLYRYYILPSVTEKKVRATQNWVWSETTKKWEVKSPLDFLKLVERPARRRQHVKATSLFRPADSPTGTAW